MTLATCCLALPVQSQHCENVKHYEHQGSGPRLRDNTDRHILAPKGIFSPIDLFLAPLEHGTPELLISKQVASRPRQAS